MKVVHISTHDNKGGAAIGTYRLHKAFLKFGIDSKMIVKYKNAYDDNSVIKMESDNRIASRIIHLLKRTKESDKPNPKYGQYSDLMGDFKVSRKEEVRDADIIYIHWISSEYIDIEEIEDILKLGKPVYWMLHDMFPVTGGCHYSLSCGKYSESCQECPFFSGENEYAYEQLNSKIALRKFDNLNYIVTSKWLEEVADISAVSSGKKTYRIPYCLDLGMFKPIDREAARKLFNISVAKKVILFGAQSALYNYYKGFSFFSDALKLLVNRDIDRDEITVLIFGSEHNEDIAKEIPFKIKFLGHLYDAFSLIMAYNCADVFVMPSLAEAFGQTVIESMACGTPVVGFNTGGIRDNVNNETGYLAEYCNSNDLEKGIYTMLYESNVNGMVEHVRRNNAEEVVVKKHMEMWKEVCGGGKGSEIFREI